MQTSSNNKYQVYQPLSENIFDNFPDAKTKDIASAKLDEVVDWLESGCFKTAGLDQKTEDIFTVWLTREIRLFLSRKGEKFYVLSVMYDHDKYKQYLAILSKRISAQNRLANPYSDYILYKTTAEKKAKSTEVNPSYALKDFTFYNRKFIELTEAQSNVMQQALHNSHLIFGPPGTGKSSTGVAKLMKLYRSAEVSELVVFVPTEDLKIVWKESWRDNVDIFGKSENDNVSVRFEVVGSEIDRLKKDRTLVDVKKFKAWLNENYSENKKKKNTTLKFLREAYLGGVDGNVPMLYEIIYSELRNFSPFTKEECECSQRFPKKSSRFTKIKAENYKELQSKLYEILEKFRCYLDNEKLFDPALSTYQEVIFNDDIVYICDEIQLSDPAFIAYLKRKGLVIGFGDYLQYKDVRAVQVIQKLFINESLEENTLCVNDVYRMSRKVTDVANVFLKISGIVTDQSPVKITTCSEEDGEALFYTPSEFSDIAAYLTAYDPSEVLFVYEGHQKSQVPSIFHAYIHSSLDKIGGREFPVLICWEPHSDQQQIYKELNNILRESVSYTKSSVSYIDGLNRNPGKENDAIMKVIVDFFLLYTRSLNTVIFVSHLFSGKYDYIAKHLEPFDEKNNHKLYLSKENNFSEKNVNQAENMCVRIYEMLQEYEPDIEQARELIVRYAPDDVTDKILWFKQWAENKYAHDRYYSKVIGCLQDKAVNQKPPVTQKRSENQGAAEVPEVKNKEEMIKLLLNKKHLKTSMNKVLQNKESIKNLILSFENNNSSTILIIFNYILENKYLSSLDVFLNDDIVERHISVFFSSVTFLSFLMTRPEKFHAVLTHEHTRSFFKEEKNFIDFCEKLKTIFMFGPSNVKATPFFYEKIIHYLYALNFPGENLKTLTSIFGAKLCKSLSECNDDPLNCFYFNKLFEFRLFGAFVALLLLPEDQTKFVGDFIACKVLTAKNNAEKSFLAKVYGLQLCHTKEIEKFSVYKYFQFCDKIKDLDVNYACKLMDVSEDEDTVFERFLDYLVFPEMIWEKDKLAAKKATSSLERIVATLLVLLKYIFSWLWVRLCNHDLVFYMFRLKSSLNLNFQLPLLFLLSLPMFIFISATPFIMESYDNFFAHPVPKKHKNFKELTSVMTFEEIDMRHKNNTKIIPLHVILSVITYGHLLCVIMDFVYFKFILSNEHEKSSYDFTRGWVTIGLTVLYRLLFVFLKCNEEVFTMRIKYLCSKVIHEAPQGFFSQKTRQAINPSFIKVDKYPEVSYVNEIHF